MNLPNYFFADLPSGAVLSNSMITEACQTLKRNRQQYLQRRPTASLIRVIIETAENWLDPNYSFRRFALERGPAETGFSEATLATGLDGFFKQLTADNLDALITQELGHPQRLDVPVAAKEERLADRAALAVGPELIVHFAAGAIPNPAFTSIVLGLLTRSAQFMKCATGSAFLPRLFAHSLYEAEPKLGACLEIAEWSGGNEVLEAALFAETNCVTATGADETLESIRSRLPSKVRFLGYGHRVSFGYITQEMLSGHQVKRLAADAARDVAAWNQLGCLSPHVFYVERGGRIPGKAFAEMLANELEKLELEEPRGPVPPESAAAIASRRALYEIRAAHIPDTHHWCSPDSTAWTVVFEADPRFQHSCLNRFIYVKEVSSLTEILRGADAVYGQISTVGLAAPMNRAPEIVTELARWGVTRVCPIGQMQNPPLTWRHDGRPALGDLVTWIDWEL